MQPSHHPPRPAVRGRWMASAGIASAYRLIFLCGALEYTVAAMSTSCALSWFKKPQPVNVGLVPFQRVLGLLPFPMQDGLLPGETLQIHLSASSSLALLETAVKRDHGCVAQLLERSQGSVCAVAPLLECRERRRHPIIGVWCSFTCVGAVRLSGIELRTPEEEMALNAEIELANAAARDDSLQYLVAEARMLREHSTGAGAGTGTGTVAHLGAAAVDDDASLVDAVVAAFEEVNALRREALALDPQGQVCATSERSTSGGDRLGPPPAVDDRVEYGYRLGPRIGPFVGLDELVELRREALCARGLDDPPDPDLGRLGKLWGTTDEEAARLRLLSFAACEALDESYRVGAAAIPHTPPRLEHALRGLQQRSKLLAAEVALMRATVAPDQEQE